VEVEGWTNLDAAQIHEMGKFLVLLAKRRVEDLILVEKQVGVLAPMAEVVVVLVVQEKVKLAASVVSRLAVDLQSGAHLLAASLDQNYSSPIISAHLVRQAVPLP